MNCKPGDLAIVVRSFAGNEGKICKVIRDGDEVGYWFVEFPSPVKWMTGVGACGYAEDSKLRPIRDQPGTDEIIRIAGKPNKEKV